MCQRSIYIRENPKYSIKPRSFENQAYGFLQTTQEKLATIRFDLLHGYNKRRHPCAIDVSRAGRIYHYPFRFFLDHSIKGLSDGRRNVQIDIAVKRQDIRTVLASASEFHLLLSQPGGIVGPVHFVSQGRSFCERRLGFKIGSPAQRRSRKPSRTANRVRRLMSVPAFHRRFCEVPCHFRIDIRIGIAISAAR